MNDSSLKHLLLIGVMVLFGAGCVTPPLVGPPSSITLPTPTLNPYFSVRNSTIFTEGKSTSTPEPEAADSTPLSKTNQSENTQITSEVIYDEALNPNWTVEHSQGVANNLRSKEMAYRGSYSISLTPQADFGDLFFAIREGSSREYLRKDIVGVRFWIYSEIDAIATRDLAVAIVGSNQYSYWVYEDQSVIGDYDPTFPETRLYDLGFNQAIPPKTWVQVEVLLDKLIYDPDYKYVTGFFVKNDSGFRSRVFLDDIEISMIDQGSKRNTLPRSRTTPVVIPSSIN